MNLLINKINLKFKMITIKLMKYRKYKNRRIKINMKINQNLYNFHNKLDKVVR